MNKTFFFRTFPYSRFSRRVLIFHFSSKPRITLVSLFQRESLMEMRKILIDISVLQSFKYYLYLMWKLFIVCLLPIVHTGKRNVVVFFQRTVRMPILPIDFQGQRETEDNVRSVVGWNSIPILGNSDQSFEYSHILQCDISTKCGLPMFFSKDSTIRTKFLNLRSLQLTDISTILLLLYLFAYQGSSQSSHFLVY